jgi:hypothetical protein
VGRRRRGAAAAVQEALFEVDAKPGIRYYRQILEALVRSGFASDADQAARIVSRLFGAVWAGEQVPRDGSMQETFGLGLVEQASQRRTPTALALLQTVAVIAPIREVRDAAAAAADSMVASGMPEPEWGSGLECAPTGRCWAYEDAFGDLATLISEHAGGQNGAHAVMVQVDYAMFSTATDISLVEDVDATVRDLQNAAQTTSPMFTLRLVEPAWARALLERAFSRTDLIRGVEVATGFADLRALAMARVRGLPDVPDVLAPEPPAPSLEARRSLVSAFLSDVEASELADPKAVEVIASLIVEYASAYDPSDMIRVSPAKWDIFLTEWLPQRGRPDPAMRGLLTDVVRAWSAWAARRRQLAPPLREDLVRALDEHTDAS